MPKQKQNQPKLEEHLNGYDKASLVGAVNSLEGSLGWTVFKSYMEYVAASHAGHAILLAQHTGSTVEASAAAAKAEVLREVAETFLPDLRRRASGASLAVHNPPPTEE